MMKDFSFLLTVRNTAGVSRNKAYAALENLWERIPPKTLRRRNNLRRTLAHKGFTERFKRGWDFFGCSFPEVLRPWRLLLIFCPYWPSCVCRILRCGVGFIFYNLPLFSRQFFNLWLMACRSIMEVGGCRCPITPTRT